MTGTFDPETKMMTLTFDEYKGLVADLGESQTEVKRLRKEVKELLNGDDNYTLPTAALACKEVERLREQIEKLEEEE